MNKLRTLLTLIVVSICAVQSAWADRSAPVLPTAVAPVSGQSYYLYNVLENKFWARSTTSTSYAALGTYGDKLTITATENNNEYTIQWASNNYYLRAYDSYVEGYYSGTDNYCYFIISESSQGYTIQRSPRNTSYYKADEFIGFNGNNGDRLNPSLAEGSIHWVFLPVDEAEHYIAKLKLYTYLTIADTYNFYVTQYDVVYNDPTSTTALLLQAYETLYDAVTVSSNYVSPSWTEYPILFQNNTDNKWTNQGTGTIYWVNYSDGSVHTSTLTGTVNVDADATLCYTYWNNNNYNTLRVYIDGSLVQTISNNQSNYNSRRYYIEMSAGKHDIIWEAVNTDARTGGYPTENYLGDIGVVNTPTIFPATTTIEGQLGTEVLKLVDPVSSVKKIVINGVIGEDDWTTIGLMVNAFSIDMSGATATAGIPASLFTKEKMPFLHSVKLPQGLTSIGDRAFYESDIENEITFPSTLETIGSYAFYNAKIKGAFMPNSVTSVGTNAFELCRFLENASYSAAAGIIPNYCFCRCNNLRTFEIPEGITEIGRQAFYEDSQFNPRFPSTMREIWYQAFENTATDELYINENMTVHSIAFNNCQNLTYAEWPTSFAETFGQSYDSGNSGVVAYCPKLKDVYLKSPTVVTYDSPNFFNGCTLSDITLHVPSYLVNAYKLDPYWYQCNVVGFDESEISDWYIKKPLTLKTGERIGGTPNLHVSDEGSISISGDDVQTVGDLSINYNPRALWYEPSQFGFMLSTTNKVNITGELSENIYTYEKQWYYLSLPFDMKVSDITTNPTASYAIRYYDGASRASVGTGSSWKNYSKDAIIPAGTGFIYQTSKDTRTKFVAQDNASKQYILSTNEFVKSLEANPSEVTANKGWNLVGNPWHTYYNIHKLNFTAPITVWDMNNRTYNAYSIIDDDYAIEPLQAFFVQCPDELSQITFPIDGRQLTSVIESQSGAPAFDAPVRKLINIELTNSEQGDKTRIVMNQQASLDYETNCDAAKFFSMDSNTPQIYTLQNGMEYAINERPIGNGTVALGVMLPSSGTYTLQVTRNDEINIVLLDKDTNTRTYLNDDAYTFSADSGKLDNRFELTLVYNDTNEITWGDDDDEATAIKNVKSEAQDKAMPVYNMNGQKVSNMQKGIYIMNGKKIIKK